MNASAIPFKSKIAPVEINDPGTGNAIPVDRSPLVIPLTIAASASETNTLAAPTGPNDKIKIYAATVGASGQRTITVASGASADGDTTLVFNAAGDWAVLESFPIGSGSYRWRLVAHEGITGALQDLVVDDLTVAAITLGSTLIGATGSEINQYCDESAKNEVVTATNVILAAESGKRFFLDLAGGFVSTLPAVALGLEFEFVVKTAPTGSYTIVCPAAATLFKGHILTNDVNSATDSDFGTAGEATVTFVLNKAVAGDRVQVVCDGTNWHVRGECSVFDAITIS